MMLGVTISHTDPARITSASYSAGTFATPVDSLALDPRNAPMTARSTPSTAISAAMIGRTGKLMEAAPAATRDTAARTRFTAARATRAPVEAAALAPRTALAGAWRWRQMNRADEVAPLTPFRAALKVRSRVASPSCDAGSSSAAVIRADASSIQSSPVEPRRLTPLAVFLSPPPMRLPIRRLALPLAASLPMLALGLASDSAVGLPARLLESAIRLFLAAPGLPFLSALSSCREVFLSALYAAVRARLSRFMTSRAAPAVRPTARVATPVAVMPARAVSSMAVWPMVSAMSVRSVPACAALDTVMAVARPSRSRRPVPRRTRTLDGRAAEVWERPVVYRIGAVPRKTLLPPVAPAPTGRPFPVRRTPRRTRRGVAAESRTEFARRATARRPYAACRAPVRATGPRARYRRPPP